MMPVNCNLPKLLTLRISWVVNPTFSVEIVPVDKEMHRNCQETLKTLIVVLNYSRV